MLTKRKNELKILTIELLRGTQPNMKRIKLRGDVADGIGCLLSSLFFIWQAKKINLSLWDGFGLSPRGFPYILSGVLALFGMLLIIQAALLSRVSSDTTTVEEKKDEEKNERIKLTVAVLVLSVMFIFSIKGLGFLISGTLFLFFLFSIIGMYSIGKHVLLSVSITGVLFVLFYYGFRISVPLGLLKNFF